MDKKTREFQIECHRQDLETLAIACVPCKKFVLLISDTGQLFYERHSMGLVNADSKEIKFITESGSSLLKKGYVESEFIERKHWTTGKLGSPPPAKARGSRTEVS